MLKDETFDRTPAGLINTMALVTYNTLTLKGTAPEEAVEIVNSIIKDTSGIIRGEIEYTIVQEQENLK